MIDLPPTIYDALQRMVHGDYSKQREIIGGFRKEKPGVTLEIGCGTGLLSTLFEKGTYAGTDVDEERIQKAQESYPDHEFFVTDFTQDYSETLERFDAVLFHGCIHHIDDAGVQQILQHIRNAVARRGRPIELMAIEPILPEPVISNIPGFMLAKLDRGRYVRTYEDTIDVIGGVVLAVKRLDAPWHWPVPGIAINVAIQ